MNTKTNQTSLKGDSSPPNESDFSDGIAFEDHKIRFATERCRGKSVLDLGCVMHNPENFRSKYWLHKALKEVSSEIIGVDLYEAGVNYLNDRGFKIIYADAQQLDLGRKFDVIVAGDLIEHIEDFHGFLAGCKMHMHDESKLIISTPNPWYWRNTVKAALRNDVNVSPEHTCWLCPNTLGQLLERHDLKINELAFGSRYTKDRIMPLPRLWKHTSFHVEAVRRS